MKEPKDNQGIKKKIVIIGVYYTAVFLEDRRREREISQELEEENKVKGEYRRFRFVDVL